MAKGWISIHRQLQNHWLWGDKPFSKGQAWVDLLLSANHEDCKFLLGGQLIEAKKGDVITSELKLMERWGWSKSKVRAFLETLENESMIVKKADKKKTTLSLVNYRVWQDSQTAEKPPKDHRETTEGPLKDTINNVNNSNNTNNIYSRPQNKFADDSIELILACELYNLILVNNPKARKPNLQSWAADVDRMIRIDKRSEEDIRALITWSQKDNFWKGNILSTSALRKQFDKLTIQMETRGGKTFKADPPNRPRSFDAIDEWDRRTEGLIE